MKKLILIMGSLLALSANTYAIAVKDIVKNNTSEAQPKFVVKSNEQNEIQGGIIPEWMKTKTGVVLMFDKEQKATFINGKGYKLADPVNVYDGTPKKGSHIKFNTNQNNEITDIWIMK